MYYACFSAHIWCGISLATETEFELTLVWTSILASYLF